MDLFIIRIHGLVVTISTFKLEGRVFESRLALFLFFFPKNKTKGEEIDGNESLGEIEL